MPKPYILARPSGRFVRFRIPADLRPAFGRLFLIRRLVDIEPDAERLAVARMGAALSLCFQKLRRGEAMDKDELIRMLGEKKRRGELSELRIGHAVASNGAQLFNVQIDTPADAQLFRQLTEGAVTVAVPGLGETLRLPAEPAAPAAPEQPAPLQPLLSQAIEDYKRERDGKRDPRGELDVANILGIFLALTGDIRIHLVGRAHVQDFEEVVKIWPSNARKKARFRHLSIPDILKFVTRKGKGPRDYALLSDRSRGKYRDVLAAFFNHLAGTDQVAKAPTKKGMRQPRHRIRKAQERRPFTTEELQRIFNPTTYLRWSSAKPHHFWGPLLALYSGGRLNEVAQLYVSDIDTVHDVVGFRIGNARMDQHIKTESSARFIPLAQSLLDAGFLLYIEDVKASGHTRLFPHLKYTGTDYGDYLGDRFIAYLVEIGLKAPPDAPEEERKKTLGMGIHWLRHGASSSLVNQGVNLNTASAITGHGKKNVMPGELARYVDKPTLLACVDAINSLPFPKIPLYTSDMFAQALKEAHGLPAKWKREDAARIKRKVASRKE